MPWAAAAGLIGAGSSIFGSFLSGKPKTTTTTTTPTLTPEMQALMQRLTAYSDDSMSNGGGAALGIQKNAAMDSINRNYMDVNQNVATQMSRRGMGSSGANGAAQYQVGLARGGAMSDLEGQFAQLGQQQKNFGASLGQNLLSYGKGSTTTGTTPDTSTGNAFMSGGNALSNLSQVLMFQNVMKGKAGGGGEG